MSELGRDELCLQGKLQVETALGALAYAGLNLGTQTLLSALLEIHKLTSDGESQEDLSFYAKGEETIQGKADIVTSLTTLSSSSAVSSEKRLAAQALYDILC